MNRLSRFSFAVIALPRPACLSKEPGERRNESEWPIARHENCLLYLEEKDLDDLPAEQGCLDELNYRAGTGILSGIHWGGEMLS